MKPSLIVIGLGNHGKSYERTRHNVGHMVIDKLAEEFGEGEFENKPKFKSVVMEGRITAAPILLAKPQTYMNLSGEAVKKLVNFYKLDTDSQILVISDDVDLPPGEIRLKERGGPGTHNGLKSIVEVIGEKFPRLRIGIGAQPAGEDLANWVLSIPPEEEAVRIRDAIDRVPAVLKEFVLNGMSR